MANINEFTPEMLEAIGKLTSDDLEAFNRFVTGSSPAILAAEITDKLAHLPAANVGDFLTSVIIAATTHKRVLTDWLALAPQVVIAGFIRTEYYVGDHINFTALNMIGHCLLASDENMNIPSIVAFRAKIDGDSIWTCDLRRASVGKEMRRIFIERRARITAAAAKDAGNIMINAIIARAVSTQINIGRAKLMSKKEKHEDYEKIEVNCLSIEPPKIEDAGLEDCALPPESVMEAFSLAFNSHSEENSTKSNGETPEQLAVKITALQEEDKHTS